MVRPRLILDIKTRLRSPFSPAPNRVNLARPFVFRLPIKKTASRLVIAAGVLYFVFGSVAAPVVTSQSYAAEDAQDEAKKSEERAELEKQLAELESQIVDHESTIQGLKSQGKTLQSEINQLNAKIGKLNLQIKAVTITLAKLDEEIVENQKEIQTTERDLDFNKDALGQSLQRVYEHGQTSLMEVLLRNPRLSDFFGDVNNLMDVQDSLSVTIQKITELKTELVSEREVLAVKRGDAAALKVYQDAQKASVAKTQSEKKNLLTATKGKESRYQQLLQETKKSAAQIRSRIFELLGGGELTFDEAYQLAKIAERATGVRAALILAVLDRESKLGENVGRCSYRSAMHPERDIPVFLEITKELNINPDTVTVSCANRDGAYGGAMGPAQFIPSTWKLYRDKIAEVTGNRPPSPWRNADAFVGTALYLQDAGAANASINEEREAAARYYAGKRWRRFLWTYGDRVVTQAQRFQQDIDILNS